MAEYNSPDEQALASEIPTLYLDYPSAAGFIAEAIIDSAWLKSHDAEIRRDQIEKDAEIAFAESRRAASWDSERAKTAERIYQSIRAQLSKLEK